MNYPGSELQTVSIIRLYLPDCIAKAHVCLSMCGASAYYFLIDPSGCWLPKKTTVTHPVAQEEEVPMPIQEVHWKTETEV